MCLALLCQGNIITMNELLTDKLLLNSSPGRDEILVVEMNRIGYRVGLRSRYEILILSDTRQPPDQRGKKIALCHFRKKFTVIKQ